MKNVILKLIGKTIFTLIYIVGILHVCVFGKDFLLLSDVIMNPDAMLPLTYSDRGFMMLALGAIPMLISCLSVYLVYDIYHTVHKRRNALLIFLPGILCGCCFLFVLGIFFISIFTWY